MPTQTITTNPAPFIIQPHLTAIAIAYRNEQMIADGILPRVPVPGETFKYSVYDKADTFTIPDTKVGRTSRPNEVDYHATEQTASTVDYGLEEPIPQKDIDNAAGSPVDPQMIATEQITTLLDLDREQRAANIVFNAANYAAANKVTLVQGNSQWSDATVNPLAQISDAADQRCTGWHADAAELYGSRPSHRYAAAQESICRKSLPWQPRRHRPGSARIPTGLPGVGSNPDWAILGKHSKERAARKPCPPVGPACSLALCAACVCNRSVHDVGYHCAVRNPHRRFAPRS